jgi:hypothetical protein
VNFGVKKLNDPLLAGNWHDNFSYASIHSQSTRTDQFGGGATGGLDDRFDFILFSDDVKFGLNGVAYVPNSCKIIGNDGSHMNGAINSAPTNTSVPDSVLQALYTMSDHLPVVCEIEITGLTQLKEMTSPGLNIDIYPNPTTRLTNIRFYNKNEKVTMVLMNGLGKVILQKEIHIDNNIIQTELDLSGLQNGVYYLNIRGDNSIVSKKVILLK